MATFLGVSSQRGEGIPILLLTTTAEGGRNQAANKRHGKLEGGCFQFSGHFRERRDIGEGVGHDPSRTPIVPFGNEIGTDCNLDESIKPHTQDEEKSQR